MDLKTFLSLKLSDRKYRLAAYALACAYKDLPKIDLQKWKLWATKEEQEKGEMLPVEGVLYWVGQKIGQNVITKSVDKETSEQCFACVAGPTRVCDLCRGNGKIDSGAVTRDCPLCLTAGHVLSTEMLCGGCCFDTGWKGCYNCESIDGSLFIGRCAKAHQVLAWNDATISSIAQRIYNEDAWDLMPILADALLDAGCPEKVSCTYCKGLGWTKSKIYANPKVRCAYCCPKKPGQMLNPLFVHLRSSSSHARGCWVIDSILGKN